VQPLVEYLRDGKPITDGMRAWLIELLDDKKKMPVRLKLVSARGGRRRTDDKIIRAYYRVRELTNAKMSSLICDDIVSNLKGRKRQIERQHVKTRYGGRIKPSIYHIKNNDRIEFTLIKGRRLSHEDACRIAALQFKLSFNYVKRSFREIEAASR
jgi:hypothetical protein